MIDAIQFSSFSEFLDMGGYAFNVWSVYGLFGIFVAANLYFPLRKRARIVREQKRRLILIEEQNKSKAIDGE
jgi:heme exporter protein CcmD